MFTQAHTQELLLHHDDCYNKTASTASRIPFTAATINQSTTMTTITRTTTTAATT